MRTPYNLRTQSASINGPAKDQTTGAVTFTAKTGLSAVPCTVQPDTSSEALEWMRVNGKRRSTIALPVTYGGVSVVVNNQDQIVRGGVAYRVAGPGMNAAGQGANRVVPVYEDI